MIRMELSRVVINETSEAQVIVLKEKEGPRSFPILIGIMEAAAIDRAVHERPLMRPLTHDLLNNILMQLDINLEKVIINDLRGGTFYARLMLSRNGEQIEIDSRPSDAIALAAMRDTPIYVEENVLEQVCKSDDFA